MATREAILDALGRVICPELRRPVTELDMVRSVDVDGGQVAVTIALTVAGCPLRNSFEDQVAREVGVLDGVDEVTLSFDGAPPGREAGANDEAARRRRGPQGAVARRVDASARRLLGERR